MRQFTYVAALVAMLAFLAGPAMAQDSTTQLTADLDRPFSTSFADDSEDLTADQDPESADVPAPEYEIELPEVPPTFFEEPLTGTNIVMILDQSCSMSARYSGVTVYTQGGAVIPNPSRWQAVQSETAKALRDFTIVMQFELIYFDTDVSWVFGELAIADTANVERAIGDIYSRFPRGCTNWYDGLQRGFENYGVDLDTVVFHSDGYPNTALSLGHGACSGHPQTRTAPIASIGGWTAMMKPGFQFLVLQQGGGPIQAMIDLAAAGGGTYSIH